MLLAVYRRHASLSDMVHYLLYGPYAWENTQSQYNTKLHAAQSFLIVPLW